MWKTAVTLLAVGMGLPTVHYAGAHRALKPIISQQGPNMTSRAAILMDERTAAILYEKDAFRQLDPASVTKMMTALLVIEHGHLSTMVTISRSAAQVPGSSLHIAPGQKYTVRDLLYGLLMRSGNDASVALAQAEAGSVRKFVAEMNSKAQELGAFNTQFENPNGLTKPGHFSTAYDLALIARKAMSLPPFRQMVGAKEYDILEHRDHRHRSVHNTNQLLYTFPYATGIKTGTTDAAGKCLVASASRNGQDLIAVVLNSHDRYHDAKKLLNWGFEHWSTVEVLQPGQTVARIPVIHGKNSLVPVTVSRPMWLSIPNQETYDLLIRPLRLTAPVRCRQPAGFVSVVTPGQAPEVELLRTKRADGVRKDRFSWNWFKRVLSAINRFTVRQ